MGAIFGSGNKRANSLYRRWRQKAVARVNRGQSAALAGAALERAVMGLAASHPEYVVTGAA